MVLRAGALHEAGRPEEAIGLLQAALAAEPHDRELLDALARVQLDVDPAEAYATAGRLIALEPEDADAHYLAALASLDVEQGKRALGHAERVAELAPWWAPGHAVLADALARRPRKRKEALAAADRAIELDPHAVVGYVAAGNVELGHARWKQAEGWYRRALELEPHNRAAQLNLVVAQEAGGKLAPAFVDVGALLRFDPRDAEARSRIDELVYTTLVHLQWIAAVLAIVAIGIRGS